MADPDAKALLRDVLSAMVVEGNDLGSMDEALPALTAFVSEFSAPDFTCLMCGLPPTPPVAYAGAGGLAKAWDDYGEAFETVRAEVEEIRESMTHVVVLVKQIATTRTGGVEISQPSAMVFAFEDGRVLRVEFHLDRQAALRGAGLE